MILTRKALFLIFVFLFLLAPTGWTAQYPLYTFDVSIDTLTKKIQAHQKVLFTNQTNQSTDSIYFHVYPHKKYTAREKEILIRYAAFFNVNAFPDGIPASDFNLKSLTLNSSPVEYSWEGDDETILKIKLPASLAPQSSVEINMEYVLSIPHVYGRFGYQDNVFALSRWYPILSVFDEKGWHNDPFYLFHRPFFSDASIYQVTLKTNQSNVVIHPGELTSEKNDSQGFKLINFSTAMPIRELSLAISPRYQVQSEKFNETTINIYYLSEGKKQVAKTIASVKDMMSFYTKKMGSYPYASFSIAPVYLGYGGEQMSSMAFIDTRVFQLPEFLDRYFDFLIAHETGHQWLYNLIGINEFKEIWLEEGLHSYFVGEYLEEKYGREGEVVKWPQWAEIAHKFFPKLTFRQSRLTRYFTMARMGLDRPVVDDLSHSHEPSSVFSLAYGKGSRVVEMLAHQMGDDAFRRAMEQIYKNYQFKTITVEEFIKVCETESQKDLQSFSRDWLYSAKRYDVRVKKIEQDKIFVENRGEIVEPTKMVIKYSDGSAEQKTLSFETNNSVVEAESGKKIKSVTLDPDHEWLDFDRTNNTWPRNIETHIVPLYTPLHEIAALMPDDRLNFVVGPEIANGGLGIKASLQKPYDEISYVASDWEFSEKIHHSRVGYQLNNVAHTNSALGFEIDNKTDYDDGDEDLVSSKAYLRHELFPVNYGLSGIIDHVSLYLLRNQGLNSTLLSGSAEDKRNISYQKRNESIVGANLHLGKSFAYTYPQDGYRLDVMGETSGHFLGATQYFNRASIDGAIYKPVVLFKGTTVALRLKYAEGFPNERNLFELGGYDGLRGYDRKSIRGSNAFLSSMEIRFPLKEKLNISCFDHLLNLETIGGVVFFDAGQSWYKKFEDSTLRKDVGAGLRLNVDIGSMLEKIVVRVDVAVPINDEENEDVHFWFGVDQAF